MIPVAWVGSSLLRKPSMTLAGVFLLSSLSFCGLWQHEVRGRQKAAIEQGVRDSLARIDARRWQREAEIARAATGVAIAKADDRAVTVIRRVARIDTLWRSIPDTLRTAADTVKALDALPEVRRATDSLIVELQAEREARLEERAVTRDELRKKDARIFQLEEMKVPAPAKVSTRAKVERLLINLAVAAVAYEIGRRR